MSPPLTDEMIQEIAAVIRDGGFLYTACAKIGVSYSRAKRWKDSGRKVRDGKEDPNQHELLCHKLLIAIEEAESANEMECVRAIRTSDENRDKQWYLERRFNKRWSRNPNAHVEVNVGGGVIDAAAEIDIREKLRERIGALIEQREIAAKLAAKAGGG